MEEIVWRWRLILVFGVKHGGTTSAKKNVPKSATKHGGNCMAVENILVLRVKHGETAVAEENVPGSATKHGGNEVARKNIHEFTAKCG